MALLRKINTKAATDENTGFGRNSNSNADRFFNKDGQPNIHIKGVSWLKRSSIFQFMLKVPVWKFLGIIVLFYLVVNLLFATVYTLIGIDNLGGMDAKTLPGKFLEAFFFSAQTLSTVGYGHVYPSGFAANAVAAIESLLGLLMFALATGLMYGRFSKPRSYLVFSEKALFAPYKDGVALMFRLAPYKKHFLTDVEIKVNLAMEVNVNGVMKNQFYSLNLELSRANTLTLNWTIVHPIDETSPLFNLTKEDIALSDAEMLVFLKGYDDEYSNTVVARTSYTFKEFVYGAKFKMMYHPSEDGATTILDLDKLNAFDAAEVPVKF
ncbi:MAG: ion channel [Chitinophagaceae bacterium]|nr:ion channel [Chitinophagaceae bacterium]